MNNVGTNIRKKTLEYTTEVCVPVAPFLFDCRGNQLLIFFMLISVWLMSRNVAKLTWPAVS